MKKILTLFLICILYSSTAQQSLKKELLKAVQQHTSFSGTALVLSGNEQVLKVHAGLSDSTSQIRNSDSTRYGLASLSKIFTMLGILDLLDQNKLSLKDSLGLFINDFEDSRAKSVTIRQLLSHRSGWGHYWINKQYIQTIDSLNTHGDFLSFIQKIPLNFDPGSEYQYSNIGYILLGIVIEKVSNQDYYTFIQEHILDPLELSSTSFGLNRAEIRAIPYTKLKTEPAKTTQGWADGGASSTIVDLQKVIEKVFLKRSIFSSISYQELMDGFDEENDETFELQGGFPGTSTSLFFHAPTNYSIIVLSNQDPPIAENVSRSIIQTLLNHITEGENVSISGITTSIRTGEIIPYVNIGIKNKGIGTASNQNGEYNIDIPIDHIADTITFSAIGFNTIKKPVTSLLNINQFNPAFKEHQESLNEVIIFGMKPKKATLGTTLLSPLASGAYIGGGMPGASLVMLTEPPKYPTYVYKVKVHVRGNKKQNLFKLRLRILKEENGRPDADLLQESMIVASSISSGWVTFDFGNFPLELEEKVFVGIEWIEEPYNKANARNAYPRISYTPDKNAKSFGRKKSLDSWNKIEIKPVIKLEVEF